MMARKVFYSFHYDNDIMRVMTVRNRWVTQGGQVASDIIDKAEFEQIKRKGESAVKSWIDKQLEGTSVTVVLLGTETLTRPYVKYEICQSINRGNAIIGVHINNIRDARTMRISSKADVNQIVGKYNDGSSVYFNDICDGIYDYTNNDGYSNLGSWVENAARIKGK